MPFVTERYMVSEENHAILAYTAVHYICYIVIIFQTATLQLNLKVSALYCLYKAAEMWGGHAFTLAVSGFSATMNMKLRLTRSVPLQMQMMQPSKSVSVFPVASNDDRILGS